MATLVLVAIGQLAQRVRFSARSFGLEPRFVRIAQILVKIAKIMGLEATWQPESCKMWSHSQSFRNSLDVFLLAQGLTTEPFQITESLLVLHFLRIDEADAECRLAIYRHHPCDP